MANKKQTPEEKARVEEIEERVSKIDTFFKENLKLILCCVAAVLVAGFCIFLYNKLYLQPKVAEAQQQMYPAEALFAAGEWELALEGDGNDPGFREIEASYGAKAGQSVYLYAGLCALQLGQYEDALAYLKKYKGKDDILAAKAIGAKADALCGLEKYEEALAAYEKAAARADNVFAASYLLKGGVVAEELGRNDKALAMYKKIKDQYPQSIEGYDVDKYISRIENAE